MAAEVPRGDGEYGVPEGLALPRAPRYYELKVPLVVAEVKLHPDG